MLSSKRTWALMGYGGESAAIGVHVVALALLGAFAWTMHGPMVAMLVASAVFVLTAATNILLLRTGRGVRAARLSRWAWVLAAFVALAAAGRNQAEKDCHSIPASLFWKLAQPVVCDSDAPVHRPPDRRR